MPADAPPAAGACSTSPPPPKHTTVVRPRRLQPAEDVAGVQHTQRSASIGRDDAPLRRWKSRRRVKAQTKQTTDKESGKPCRARRRAPTGHHHRNGDAEAVRRTFKVPADFRQPPVHPHGGMWRCDQHPST